MRLILDGPVNVYYVQTLCMIFFPGAKFGAAEQNDPAAPEVKLTLREVDGGMEANATADRRAPLKGCNRAAAGGGQQNAR